MPVVTIPPELKKITPYVRRAEELDKDKTNAESRLVAYYCRQYAVHTGISLATSAAGKTCLGELLSDLEQEKEAMNQFTREEAKFLCRLFANKIFDKADGEDRMGEASKGTAKTFYAAASFLEILNQFYNADGDDADSEEVEEIKKKAVYGKWKATEILKAIKEGRRPTPGGYGEEEPEVPEDEDETGPASKGGSSDEPATTTVETVEDGGAVDDAGDDETQSEPEAPLIRLPSTEDSVFENRDVSELSGRNSGTKDLPMDADLPPPPAYDFAPPPLGPPTTAPARGPSRPPMTIPPPVPPAPAMVVPPPAAAAPAPNPSPEKKSIFGFGRKQNNKLSKAEYADAVELTKFAMAAMEDKNSELAAERLGQAMEVLNRNK
jgi:vacuolar protein sorting-associated protein VTA1